MAQPALEADVEQLSDVVALFQVGNLHLCVCGVRTRMHVASRACVYRA